MLDCARRLRTQALCSLLPRAALLEALLALDFLSAVLADAVAAAIHRLLLAAAGWLLACASSLLCLTLTFAFAFTAEADTAAAADN